MKAKKGHSGLGSRWFESRGRGHNKRGAQRKVAGVTSSTVGNCHGQEWDGYGMGREEDRGIWNQRLEDVPRVVPPVVEGAEGENVVSGDSKKIRATVEPQKGARGWESREQRKKWRRQPLDNPQLIKRPEYTFPLVH